MTKEPNLDTILNHTFKHAKKLARHFYFKRWAKKPPHCPAFNNEVVSIGREGWEHIIDAKHRTKMDLLGRLFTLEKAKYLLETSITYQDYQKSHDLEFWAFDGIVSGTKVRVIVRSIKKGSKHFYSVIRRGSVENDAQS